MKKSPKGGKKTTKKISFISIKMGLQFLTSFFMLKTNEYVYITKTKNGKKVKSLYHRSFPKKLIEEPPHSTLNTKTVLKK